MSGPVTRERRQESAELESASVPVLAVLVLVLSFFSWLSWLLCSCDFYTNSFVDFCAFCVWLDEYVIWMCEDGWQYCIVLLIGLWGSLCCILLQEKCHSIRTFQWFNFKAIVLSSHICSLWSCWEPAVCFKCSHLYSLQGLSHQYCLSHFCRKVVVFWPKR